MQIVRALSEFGCVSHQKAYCTLEFVNVPSPYRDPQRLQDLIAQSYSMPMWLVYQIRPRNPEKFLQISKGKGSLLMRVPRQAVRIIQNHPQSSVLVNWSFFLREEAECSVFCRHCLSTAHRTFNCPRGPLCVASVVITVSTQIKLNRTMLVFHFAKSFTAMCLFLLSTARWSAPS